MNKELSDAWVRACSSPGEPIDIGRSVVCDSCNEDYTDSAAPGGLIFYSKAICPECEPHWMASITKNSEEQMIRAKCPAWLAFADFVREYRGPNNQICIGPMQGIPK